MNNLIIQVCNFNYLLFFLITFLPAGVLSAQQVSFTIDPSMEHVSLGKNIEILEDKTGELTILDVTSPEMSQHFSPSEDEEPSFGFTSSAYWVKLTIKNPLDDPVEWFLEIGYPLIDFIDLYIPDGYGAFVVKKTGDRLPFNTREISYRNVLFRLNENPDSQKTYYVRFETSSSMNFPLHFWLQDALLEKISVEQILFGVFYGAVLIMIIYNVFLFLGFRDRSYVYYVLFITSFGLLQLALNGLAFQYLWSNWSWWANVNVPFFIFASSITLSQLGRYALNTKENAPLWDKILKFENILFIAGMLFSLLMPYAVSIRIGTASAIIAIVGLIIISLICVKQRHRPAYYFTAAWSLFFFGVILFSLKTFGVLPSNFITNWSIQIGAFAMLVLLSLALGDRINTEKKEKYLAQKEVLKGQQQLVETLKESERILEQRVSERTAELEAQNISLNKKTKELQDSHAQLIQAEKMASLGELTAGIAHEIKNPLNYINNFAELSVGLVDDLKQDIEKIKDSMDSKTVEHVDEILKDLTYNAGEIKQSGSRADNIIQGMLLHSRGGDGERQDSDINVLLDQYLALAYHSMRAQHSTFEATMENDYDESIGKVSVVPQDLGRVFLNILNNACHAIFEKTKNSEVGYSPTLSVSTKSLGNKIEIRIRDNGHGIPEEIKDKIFNPFFTTKPTGEGTGLGLSLSYDIIVKEHRGDIKVESEKGSFTEFIITLPNDQA